MDKKIVVLAASLGGPPLVNDILSGMDSHLTFPLVVLQQMESDFSEPLTSAWSRTSSLSLVRLSDEQKISEGRVYIIPYGFFPKFTDNSESGRIIPEICSDTSSIDSQWNKTLIECSKFFGENMVLVLLTSIGLEINDLREGLDSVRSAGGTLIKCRESISLIDAKAKSDSKIGGCLEMSIDQIIEYLHKLSFGKAVQPDFASGNQEGY